MDVASRPRAGCAGTEARFLTDLAVSPGIAVRAGDGLPLAVYDDVAIMARQRLQEMESTVRFLAGVGSLILIAGILVDAFEAVLLPRRVSHGYRYLRFFYRQTWRGWRRLVRLVPSPRRQATLLSVFGPVALLVLFCTWAGGLVVAFGTLHWALETPITSDGTAVPAGTYLYFSGTTFFTLGYGDLTPRGTAGRFLAVIESGLGFAFLAMIIGYLPVLGQAFSRREIVISLLDARAGSPPSAAQILIRRGGLQTTPGRNSELVLWETWSAELLEGCLSFPMLAYYRSQHDNQSWLAALTVILDACVLEICGAGRSDQHQARLTFAIARHAAVDLTLVFKITPRPPTTDRLEPAALARLRQALGAAGIPLAEGAATDQQLAELRAMYEPFVNGLAEYFLLRLPEFAPERLKADNWQTSAWMPHTPGILELPILERGEHFE